MTGSALQSQLDPILLPFLHATEEPAVQQAQDALILQADRVIKGIIGQKLRVSFNRFGEAHGADAVDAEGAQNVYGRVQLQLLKKLALLRADAHQNSIGDWRGFVAKVAYNKVSDYLRTKHPHRYSLENKLRFLFENQSGFATWYDDAAGLVCGYVAWRQQPIERSHNLSRLLDDPHSFAHEALPGKDPQRLPLPDLAQAILQWIGCPLKLDSLIQIIATLQNVKEDIQISARHTEEDDEEELILRLPDPQPGQDRVLLVKLFLQRILDTVAAMSLRHRYALLLNLRDENGGNALVLFPPTGIATISRLAQMLEMSPPQLAALWHRLPLPDLEIARLLDCERSQIISCRNSVRRVLVKLRKDFA